MTACDESKGTADVGGEPDVEADPDVFDVTVDEEADVDDIQDSGGPTVLAVDNVTDLTALVGVESADVENRPDGAVVIELAAGVYELTEPLLLPPGWELHGTNEYVDVDEDGVWDSRSDEAPVFADPDNETVIDGMITLDETVPWRSVSCSDKAPTSMPHPVVLYTTQNGISGITFINGGAYVGPAFDNWLGLDERKVEVTDCVMVGGLWEIAEDTYFSYPEVHMVLGAVGCSSADHPHEVVSRVEGNVLIGGFWGFMVFNRSSAPGSSARAVVSRNRTIELGQGTTVGSAIDEGVSVVESSGNIYTGAVGGLAIVGGADMPPEDCLPYGIVIDTDHDGVPDAADRPGDGLDPMSLEDLTGIADTDVTGVACPDVDYGIIDQDADSTPDTIVAARDGARDSQTTLSSEGDTFAGNYWGVFAGNIRHDVFACAATGNAIEVTIADGTFADSLDNDIVVAGALMMTEGDFAWMTNDETHITLRNSPVASCLIRDSYWVAGEDDTDCTTHGQASPDTYGNDATVAVETE